MAFIVFGRRKLSVFRGQSAGLGLLCFASIAFWYFLHRATLWPSGLFVGLSLASFAIGCILGFVFSSYGEEGATIGKIRDWLVGGVATLTIAKFSSVEKLLVTFSGAPGPIPFALAFSVCITYLVCGFFTMFLQRELILNVLLAESRKKRTLLEGNQAAGDVARDLLSNAPLNMLLGTVSVDEWEEASTDKEEALDILSSEKITKFLEQAEQAVQDGANLDWEIVSKAATLHYYLSYAVEKDERHAQIQLALTWIKRALVLYPSHVDLGAKYADLLNAEGKSQEAILELRRVLTNQSAPAYARQWLAVYLLAIPGNELESIKLSEEYLAAYPDEYNSYFNIARGYAALYNRLSANPSSADDAEREVYRVRTIESLRKGLLSQLPDELEKTKTWVRSRDVYQKFLDMPDFESLVKPTASPAV